MAPAEVMPSADRAMGQKADGSAPVSGSSPLAPPWAGPGAGVDVVGVVGVAVRVGDGVGVGVVGVPERSGMVTPITSVRDAG